MAKATDDGWPARSYRTIADQVYDALRDRILRGAYGPGEFVREQEVSRAMQTSHTPVREALSRLASEGFLERIPHRGYRLPVQSIEDLLELYPVLSWMELLATAMALPRLDRDDVSRLREINDRLVSVMKNGDPKPAIRLNAEFHRALFEKCANDRLCRLVEDLGLEVTRLEIWSFEHHSHREQTIRDHEEIVRAIEEGKHRRALQVLRRDRLSAYLAYLEEIQGAEDASAESDVTAFRALVSSLGGEPPWRVDPEDSEGST